MGEPIQSSYSESERERLYKRTLTVVSISQLFGGAGLAAGITVGALLAEDILGTPSYAGLPTALFTIGSAVTAFIVGKTSQHYGRRIGLTIGFIVGGLGALGVVLAAILQNIFLLFFFLFLYGAGTATNLQARYAGSDLANENQRGKAVSLTMVMTTFGAVLGPNLVNIMGEVAGRLTIPPLAGPFLLSALAYIAAGIVLFILLRPDPFILAKQWVAEEEKQMSNSVIATKNVNKYHIVVGATVMILTQLIMVAIMTMTPVHMLHHGHTLQAIGVVIGVHIGAMYLPSLFTGVLVDRLGRYFIAIAAGVTLLLSGITAASVPEDSLFGLILALALLGLGWNFGLISGTTLIVDGTTNENRAHIQGKVDVFIALSGATGGLLSGMVVAHSSYATLSIVGGLISFILVPIVFWPKLAKANS
ncbi:MFS transporter [Cytobacillus sp. FSL R7-0696]|uniref:MFS transporter n=1 Tax=Cytobacillus sp. FSL R7-0696 TaxID=2921691 RepID=UPI0030F561FB